MSTPDTGAPAARVIVYTRQRCHLCEVALRTVEQVCRELGEAWAEVDIDADQALRERYTEQVPVTVVDGQQHDFWRVDPDRLRAALITEPV